MKHEKERIKEEAFLKVFEANVGVVIKIAKAYTNTTHDREDLTNDIVFELWKSFDTFAGRSSVSTWIYRVALNTSMNYKKRKKKDSLFTFWDNSSKFEGMRWLIEQEDTPETELLYRCIDQLDAINKAIILLYLEEKSHEEISVITGISKTNVGTRISRIKEQIRKALLTSN